MPVIERDDGVHIHYEDKGAGHALVLLHGWAMSGRVWGFQRDLAGSCRVITPDLRGHGASSSSERFGLEELAGDLAALADHLELQGAVVVGWSLGAQVALKCFSSIRDRVAGLILVGGTPRFSISADYDAGLSSREIRGLEARLKRDYSRTMGEFFRRMFAPGELSREQESRIAREIVMGSRLPELAVAQAGLAILDREDLRHILPGVDRPVLLVHGEEDTICPPAAAHCMKAHLTQSRLALLPKTGHAPFLSQPEEFNRTVREYLQEIHGSH